MTSRLNEREFRYNLMLSAIFRWFNRSDSFFFWQNLQRLSREMTLEPGTSGQKLMTCHYPDMVSACDWLKNRL